ncbi:hypothetical protein JCGZ_03876 [Jatropha curcas]|uniref:Protein ARABIDILLO 1 n=1 Tax=Jatropha curcas TaxID=180498 RepID=A0A067KW69_JATCU|nr:hypothetical protein JCGZ_03876 [Jatropha curcas]
MEVVFYSRTRSHFAVKLCPHCLNLVNIAQMVERTGFVHCELWSSLRREKTKANNHYKHLEGKKPHALMKKIIYHFSVDSKVAKALAEIGGIYILADLARSMNRLVTEDAAGGLWNHFVGEEHKEHAAGALANLAADDKCSMEVALAGSVHALVMLAKSCKFEGVQEQGLQERAAGALWGLSVSEANSLALVALNLEILASSPFHFNEGGGGRLAFNPGNARCIAEDGGVPALVHLCTPSLSKMAHFMAALALAYMFDGRMDVIVAAGPLTEGASKFMSLEVVKSISLKHVEGFVHLFSDSQTLASVVASSAPNALSQVAEAARIPEAGF